MFLHLYPTTILLIVLPFISDPKHYRSVTAVKVIVIAWQDHCFSEGALPFYNANTFCMAKLATKGGLAEHYVAKTSKSNTESTAMFHGLAWQ